MFIVTDITAIMDRSGMTKSFDLCTYDGEEAVLAYIYGMNAGREMQMIYEKDDNPNERYNIVIS